MRRVAQVGLSTILKMADDETPVIVVLAAEDVPEVYVIHDYWPSPDIETGFVQQKHAEDRLAQEAVTHKYRYGCLWVHTITNDRLAVEGEEWGIWRRPQDGDFTPDDGEEEQMLGLVFDLDVGIDMMRAKIIRVGGIVEPVPPVEIVTSPAYIDPNNPGVTLVRALSSSLEEE